MAAPRGFTLVECATVCAVVAVLASVAWPSWRGHSLRAARLDAVQALTRVQVEQEAHRSQHGLYASDVRALRGVSAASLQGRYAITLTPAGADGYRASATALGVQARDRDCPALTLDVQQGWARPGPSALCWNR